VRLNRGAALVAATASVLNGQSSLSDQTLS
jgi:hypothetical protein